jgi:uncharacterized protein YegL
MSDKFSEALTSRGVESKFHDLLSQLSGGETDYLIDIVSEDLVGCADAEGEAISEPLANELLSKLHQMGAEDAPTPSSAQPLARSKSVSTCRVSLLRGAAGADSTILRCALRGELTQGGVKRHKVLAVVLDRSGSMAGAMWRRLVEGVASVVTDKLLADSSTCICLVVYSDEAREIWMPASTQDLRDLLLSREYSPQGGTCFKAAFRVTQEVVNREVKRYLNAGIDTADIDIATLVFTDGEDTSVKGRVGQYGVRLVDKEASSTAARQAGDAFRKALLETGCTTYVCIAAFGADHDPDMCQYLSDRYYFINRGEALSEVLAGGLGALLNSAGQCSLRVSMPPGVELEEGVPDTLPLDSCGRLEHHIWLRAPTGSNGTMAVDVEVANASALTGTALIGSECVPDADSFEDHLFRIDFIALQLRRIARELCGRRPSADELTRLRERLLEAKNRLQPTKDVASVATGQLRGRTALRERVAEIEALRERLSYALGQFDDRDTNDERKIGSTAIDAILRDAGQHVPAGPATASLVQQSDVLDALPPPEELSAFGKEYTSDAYSCCNAYELACQGDALFYKLSNVKPAQHGGFITAVDGLELISLEAFSLLSRGGKQAVKGVDASEGFTHVGFPLYCSEGHFLRAHTLLTNVLPPLSPNSVYEQGVSELQLVSLLGRSLAASPVKTEAEFTALLHKARSVQALVSRTLVGEAEDALLNQVVAEVKQFVEEPQKWAEVTDLFRIAGAGLMVETSDAGWFVQLGDALTAECLRRRIQHALRSASDSTRLCLACSLLGPADSDDAWMDMTLPCPDAGELAEGSLNPFKAPDELETSEKRSPGKAAPGPDGARSLISILSAKCTDNSPRPSEWSTLRQQLKVWGEVLAHVKGSSNLWACLDSLMVKEDVSHGEQLQGIISILRSSSSRTSLRCAFPDVAAVTTIATSACLGDISRSGSLRESVAAEMRELVEKRKVLVNKYPIAGSSFPALDEHSRETVRDIWGAPANPTDLVLHHKAYLRVWRRTMGCRITMTTKEALTDKEYRKRGGKFVFPSPLDTFVRGLHRRTQDLHRDWIERLKKETSGDKARQEAVAEMLLRLRWDDSDETARKKLSKIIARIWDDLEGVDLSCKAPLSSALWLNDDDEADVFANATVVSAP